MKLNHTRVRAFILTEVLYGGVVMAAPYMEEIRGLQLPNANAPTAGTVTVSIGVSTQYPLSGTKESVAVGRLTALFTRQKKGVETGSNS